MTAALKRLPKNAFELEISVPKPEIDKVYEEIIVESVKNTELPGFRKGSAPRDRVESSLDKAKIYEEVLQRIVPRFYLQAVKEHSLKPILNPRVQLKSAKEGEDWSFTATSCEAPDVKIEGYKEEVKKAVATDSLWVPGKGDPTKKEEPNKDQKLNLIIDHLLATFPIDPADMLIEEEANHSLARLIDQTQQLGITVEQYLASTGKTPEALKADYAVSAKRSLQVEFLLDAIGKDLNIEIPDKEVDEVIAASADQESKKSLDTPAQRSSIKAILGRRRVLDSLTSIS